MKQDNAATESVPIAVPPLDSGFVAAEVALRDHEQRLAQADRTETLAIALSRPDGTTFVEKLLLPKAELATMPDFQVLERHIKRMLWQKGGSRLSLCGSRLWTDAIAAMYTAGRNAARSFDATFMGRQLFAETFAVKLCTAEELPVANEPTLPLGGNLKGCRIGFDLGGSDRKCAAVIDGKVVFSEEIAWDPYFQSDPQYHIKGIEDCIQRAAAHLPRVDAIGGSAAGVYIGNHVLAGSLFRGLSEVDFNTHIRRLFHELELRWGVPVSVANDGEVTALAAALNSGSGNILGLAMGTSTAAGYVNAAANLTTWLNELAFVPVDYRPHAAPIDEWSGDGGCAVQYFSQQAVARLGPLVGIGRPQQESYAQYLQRIQSMVDSGDESARKVFTSIGCYLGHTLPFWRRFYAFDKLLLLGRVMSGEGGSAILKAAKQVLTTCYPAVAAEVSFIEVNERDKRHGQAIAAASLPLIP